MSSGLLCARRAARARPLRRDGARPYVVQGRVKREARRLRAPCAGARGRGPRARGVEREWRGGGQETVKAQAPRFFSAPRVGLCQGAPALWHDRGLGARKQTAAGGG